MSPRFNGSFGHFRILESTDDILTIKHCFKCLQRASVMHENNRQQIIEAGIVDIIKTQLQSEEPFIIKEACGLVRMLVLDDDIRVEISKAHEHAREIAGVALEEITKLLDSENWETFVISGDR